VGGDWQLQEQAWWMMNRNPASLKYAQYKLALRAIDPRVKIAVVEYVEHLTSVIDDYKRKMDALGLCPHGHNGLCPTCDATQVPAPTVADDAARYYRQADAV
jgi:hypothetical protein